MNALGMYFDTIQSQTPDPIPLGIDCWLITDGPMEHVIENITETQVCNDTSKDSITSFSTKMFKLVLKNNFRVYFDGQNHCKLYQFVLDHQQAVDTMDKMISYFRMRYQCFLQ